MKLLKAVRRCSDGMYRRFEQRMASTIIDLTTGEAMSDPEQPEYDHPVWITTGVFKTRKEAFNRRGVHHEDRS